MKTADTPLATHRARLEDRLATARTTLAASRRRCNILPDPKPYKRKRSFPLTALAPLPWYAWENTRVLIGGFILIGVVTLSVWTAFFGLPFRVMIGPFAFGG